MKNRLIIIYSFLALLFSACENLDQDFTVTLTQDEVTKSYEYTKYRAIAVYSELKNGFEYIDGAMLASATDDAEHTIETSAIQNFNTGNWNMVYNPDDVWEHYYQAIRKANQFLVSADSVDLETYRVDPDPGAQEVYQARLKEIENWKVEVRLLRAYFYFELVKRYGGVPLVTELTTLNEDYSGVNRSSLEDCLDFIVDECDYAAAELPESYADSDLGRVTSGTALAIKSRVLLYAASNLFNNDSWAGGYANNELISLTGDQQSKWEAAADAAKDVIDLERYWLSSSYSNLFGSDGFLNNEVIFSRRNGASNSFEIMSAPPGYDLGQGGTNPSQGLVDAYQMTDGSDFDWNNPEMAANPYENRDPRLKYTILTNNAWYKSRNAEIWEGGLDGKGTFRATKTGYYLKKYVNSGLDLLQNRTSVHSWILIRMAEIYLNYAEALNEAEPGNPDILAYLNLVRSRSDVQMPAIPSGLSQEKMREIIHRERRVELAFEGHRFWDVRRWMEAEKDLAESLTGVAITKIGDSFNYQVTTVESRSFSPKMYLYPIPQSELNINTQWVQNPLW